VNASVTNGLRLYHNWRLTWVLRDLLHREGREVRKESRAIARTELSRK
jgi:hypothetical protein